MKKIHLLGCLLLACFSGQSPAEPATRVAWTPETLGFVRNGDPVKGKELAQACEGCHAVSPANSATPYPYLQGQTAAYLYKQLQDYKSGSRANELMAGFAAGLSDQDMADIAAWYSRENAPTAHAAENIPDEIETLVERGDGNRIVAPCSVCHGGSGEGKEIDNPALAAQKAEYLQQTLAAYKSGTRHNDAYGRMRLIAAQLSDEEIKLLARYYAGSGR